MQHNTTQKMEFLKETYNITTPEQFGSWCEEYLKKIDFDNKDITPEKEEYYLVFMAGRNFLLGEDISAECPSHKKTLTEDNLYLQKFAISQKMRKKKLIEEDDSKCAAMVNFTHSDILPDGKGNSVPAGKRRCKNKHKVGSEYCHFHRNLESVVEST